MFQQLTIDIPSWQRDFYGTTLRTIGKFITHTLSNVWALLTTRFGDKILDLRAAKGLTLPK
jgi:hypothetical protein